MKRALHPLSECEDPAVTGGKATNLGRLLRAGFPVPEGFVIPAGAGGNGTFSALVAAAWQKLGAGPVAVRSSAPGEDGAEKSAAGQFDSFLDIRDEAGLMEAIRRCRESLENPRAKAYRRDPEAGMAVIVQRFIPAEISGVMFTADPQREEAMRIEAARGTGEALVSGRIRPEVWRIDRATGQATALEQGDFADPILDQATLLALRKTGDEIAQTLGGPQDIEWAICAGEFFVLQARPITTEGSAAAREQRLEALKSALRQDLAAGHGPWALHSLSESLRAPTTLTWSVMERHLSARGGFGRLYQMVGFAPSGLGSPARCVAGGIYSDLAAAPSLFDPSLRYDLDLVRREPAAAQALPTLTTGSPLQRLRARWRLRAVERRLREPDDRSLTEIAIPKFAAWCATEKARDLGTLDAGAWLKLWRERERRVFDEFAPEILRETLRSTAVVAKLRAFVLKRIWDEDSEAVLQSLSADAEPSPILAGLRRLGNAQCTLEDWLQEWGHRGPDEMELASPRWREQPERVGELAIAAAGEVRPSVGTAAAFRQRLTESDASQLLRLSARARRALRFRETGRHWTMLGWDLLRDLALEAGKRLGIGEGVFHLTPGEIAEALGSGIAPHEQIARRECERSLDRSIFLPPLIEAEAIENLGQLPDAAGGNELRGTGISAGTAAGRVRMVERIETGVEIEAGDIVVCPTLDPNLTPLLLRAGGLIVECGGALSHAAIVAREMNVPAVVLPGATALLRDAATVGIDGSSGIVRADGERGETRAVENVPPPPSRREAEASRLMVLAGGFWSLTLLLGFVLPRSWIREPCLKALDAILWPLVVAWGKAEVTAVVALGLALALAVMQRGLINNDRLRLAKERAKKLPRHEGTERLIAGVQRRVMTASAVAPALLLGPLVLIMGWFSVRFDPAMSNPPPGTDFTVLATVRSDFHDPVRLDVPSPLRVDPITPAVQRVPPLRATLENLLFEWEKAGNPPREKMADLRAYLAEGVPDQKLRWKISAEEAREGRYRLAVRAAEEAPVRIEVAFGASRPPAEKWARGKGSVREVEVISGSSISADPVWRPFGWAGFDEGAGWLSLYLAVYLGAAALFRRVFRLA